MTVEGEHGSEVRVRGGKRHSGREESTELSFSRAGSLCREAGRQGARETIAANMCVPQYQQRASGRKPIAFRSRSLGDGVATADR